MRDGVDFGGILQVAIEASDSERGVGAAARRRAEVAVYYASKPGESIIPQPKGGVKTMEEKNLKVTVKEAVREALLEWEEERKREEFRGALKGFFVHLALYFMVNVGCTIYVLAREEPYFWPIWPIIFWGAGVIAHLAGVLTARRALRA